MSEKNYVATPLQVFEHDAGPVVPEPADAAQWPVFPEDDTSPPSVRADGDADPDDPGSDNADDDAPS